MEKRNEPGNDPVEVREENMLTKQTSNERNDTDVMLGEDSEDERYNRYKKICYCNLVFKSLLAFLLGIFVCYLFRFL